MNAKISRLVVEFAFLPGFLLVIAASLFFTSLPALAQTPEVTPDSSTEAEPTPVPTPAETLSLTPTSAVTATVLVDVLNLRAGPATTHAKLGTARKGALLTVQGKTANCAWLRVSTAQGAPAWVSGNGAYVRLSAPCAGVAVASPDAIPTPIPLPTSTPKAEPTTEPAPPATGAPVVAASEIPAAAEAPAAAPEGTEAASAPPAEEDRPARPTPPPPYVPDPSAFAFVLPYVKNPDYHATPPDDLWATMEDPAKFAAYERAELEKMLIPVFAVDKSALACEVAGSIRSVGGRLSIVFERVGSGEKIAVSSDDVVRDKVSPDGGYSHCLQPGTYRYIFIREGADYICSSHAGEFEARAGDVLPAGFWRDKAFYSELSCWR